MEEIKCEQVCMLSGGKWDKLHDQSRRVYGVNGLAPTMHTCGGGNLEPKILEPLDNSERPPIKHAPSYRIRKLTERECFRLQGVKEEDFERVAKNQSTSALYHEAGDSIVTTCLMAIFGELFDCNYREKINSLVEELRK